MFSKKYECLYHFLTNDDFKNNETLKVNKNTSNVLFIHDYDVTTKISQYYLNTNIPISRTSNTAIIKNPFSSYIYDIVAYLLKNNNYAECYSNGEFNIKFDKMYNISIELDEMIQYILKKTNNGDPMNIIVEIFDDIINKTFDDEKYSYLDDKCESGTNNSKIEEIKDTFTEEEYINKNIYIFDDNDSSESDDNSVKSDNSEELRNNIKTNLVNILGRS